MFKKTNQAGFSIIEVLLAAVIFPIIVFGLFNASLTVQRSYAYSRQLNEIYAVLSACPELDRALEYNSIDEDNNCFPNNEFVVEGGSDAIITYTPVLLIEDTDELPVSNDLADITDAKLVSIDVDIPNMSVPQVELRLLIARNGLGQQ